MHPEPPRPAPNASLETALRAALEAHRTGRLGAAEADYRGILDSAPGHPQALHLLGVVLHQTGRHEQAVALIQQARAAGLAGPEVDNNLGQAQRALGHLEAAAACFQRAISADDGFFAAHNNLGLLLLAQGDAGAAVARLRRALAIDPDDVEVRWNLGDALLAARDTRAGIACFQEVAERRSQWAPALFRLGGALMTADRIGPAIHAYRRAAELAPDVADIQRELGRACFRQELLDDATAAYRCALALAPQDLVSRCHLGAILQQQGAIDEAIDCYRQVLAVDATLAEAHNQLGACLDERGDPRQAIACFQRALELDDDLDDAQLNLGRTLMEMREFERAEEALRAAAERPGIADEARRVLGYAVFHLGRLEEAADHLLAQARAFYAPDNASNRDAPAFSSVTHTKLRHDVEQLQHLVETGKLPADFDAVVASYRAALAALPAAAQENYTFPTPDIAPFRAHYNRLLFDAPEPVIADGALNPALDIDAIERAFHGNEPGWVCCDDFLTPRALNALQRFAMEPTVWFEMTFRNEVGTNMRHGFCCPLLLQIAHELREAFPRIYGKHLFSGCFTYKYYQNALDGHLHADRGAVTVNFWITPDEANLDPGTGGLVIWNKRVPDEWFTAPQARMDAIERGLLGERDARSSAIPYRCNRAMLFNANVLHKSARMHFKEGLANRRVSITMLFGKPGQG